MEQKEIKTFRGKNEFLSNFFYCPVTYNGNKFACLEAAFQSAKTLDPNKKRLFCIAPSAAEARRLGRQIELRQDWQDVKVGIMEELLRQKFSDPILRQKLIDTGTAQIINGNSYGDKYWGCVKGEGENMLGKLLMKIREELLEQK